MTEKEQAKLNRIKQAIKNEELKVKDVDINMTKQLADKSLDIVDIDKQLSDTNTIGKRLADKVAQVGGSWGFVITFMVFLVIWMAINVLQLFGMHFDPYPFILLNLALSCISAIQAPIIMMSQNRAGEVDAMTRDNDYKLNQKAEIHLRKQHSKQDTQLKMQQNIFETQCLLIEMIDELKKK